MTTDRELVKASALIQALLDPPDRLAPGYSVQTPRMQPPLSAPGWVLLLRPDGRTFCGTMPQERAVRESWKDLARRWLREHDHDALDLLFTEDESEEQATAMGVPSS